jgi:hypothetical protein
MRATLHALAVAGLALALAATPGCRKRALPEIPVYPGSSQASGHPNEESEAGTLYHGRRVTPDRATTAAAFYRTELVEKAGWTESQRVGPAFSDGNLTVDQPGVGPGRSAPVDPSRRGGYVLIYEQGNATFVETWEWVPAAR